MKSVYCEVRTGSLNKEVCASSLKGLNVKRVLKTHMHCMKIFCIRQRLVFQSIAVMEENGWTCRFRNEGATARTVDTTQFLQELLNDCFVRSGLWPPRSPGLTSPDPILCRFRKEIFYINNSRMLKDLKHNTRVYCRH